MPEPDPLSLPRIAPSKLGSPPRARRRPDVNGCPHPDNPIRWPQDRPILQAIVVAAWRAYVAELELDGMKNDLGRAIEANLAQTYPAADMLTLAVYGYTRSAKTVWLSATLFSEPFLLAAGRELPRDLVNIGGELRMAIDENSDEGLAPVARGYLAARREADQLRLGEFDAAISWVGCQHATRQPAPTWAAIERHFPRIGAWLQKTRNPA